jgi:hypothetical protein
MYCGHRCETTELKKLNKSMANTGCSMVPFHFYVGSKSKHPQKLAKGYVYIGLKYIVAFGISNYQRIAVKCKGFEVHEAKKTKTHQYQWNFMLSDQKPSQEQLEQMRSTVTMNGLTFF